MSFGAIVLIASGSPDQFRYLPPEHECAVTEIRVEQHLDKQTTFALRFQEDFEDEEQIRAAQELFSNSLGVAICVPNGAAGLTPAKLVCLVRGQVERVEFNVTVGGSGSWFEVRGQDLRTQLNRRVEVITARGSTTQIIEALVAPIAPAQVGPAIKNYTDHDYRYMGSALEAVSDLARKSSYAFWLEYEVEEREGVFTVKTTAHVKSSPPRKDDGPRPPDPSVGFELVADAESPRLLILGNDGECETVVNFSSEVDSEAYTTASSYAQNSDDGTEQANKDADSQDQHLNSAGGQSPSVGGQTGAALTPDVPGLRSLSLGVEPELEIAIWQAYAAATAASWYVRAEALTTVHMLNHVLVPHQLVTVDGGGCGIAGTYQVSDVTHVINAAEHWMQVKLRSNSRSIKSHPNLP